MEFLNKFKLKNTIVAQQSGKAVHINEVPDPVFSDKVLGDGIAIIPSENKVVAPISGTIVQIADTMHAFCIESDDGLEVLVHLGLDTVKLKGKGFKCHVKTGQHVQTGDTVMDMDIEFIKNEGYNVITPCIITNMDKIKKITVITGTAELGKTGVIKYEIWFF